MEHKKLCRSSTNKILTGLCGGLGTYFGVDANLVRLVWIIFGCMGGAGIVAYVLASLIIPRDDGFVSVQ